MADIIEYIAQAETQLLKFYSNKQSFKNDIRKGFKFAKPNNRAEEKIILVDSDNMCLISEDTFEALISAGREYEPMYIQELWKRLVDTKIFVKMWAPSHGDFALADHQLDRRKLLEHLLDNTFYNLFFPPSNLYNRYAPAIVAVDVENSQGTPTRGSGFVVKIRQEPDQWLVTCRHNVDPDDGICLKSFTNTNGQTINRGKFYPSSVADIAICKLETILEGNALSLSDEGSVFDEVYTLGFPQVPGAQPLLLGHRGEINGRAELYMEKCEALIISNLVSPGSSGCPVLNKEGRCLGMTINWLEGEWGDAGKQKARFSAALPASLLLSQLDVARSQL